MFLETHRRLRYLQYVLLRLLQCVGENCYHLNPDKSQQLNGTLWIHLHIEESVHIMIWDVYFLFAFTFCQQYWTINCHWSILWALWLSSSAWFVTGTNFCCGLQTKQIGKIGSIFCAFHAAKGKDKLLHAVSYQSLAYLKYLIQRLLIMDDVLQSAHTPHE